MPQGTEPPPGVWARAVARAVSELAADAGVSRAELARRAGVHPSTLSRCLTGRRSLTLDETARLSEALGLPPASVVLRAQAHRRRDVES